MVKLALLDRSGTDSRDLLRAQLARLAPGRRRPGWTALRATHGFRAHPGPVAARGDDREPLRFLQALAAQEEVADQLVAAAARGDSP